MVGLIRMRFGQLGVDRKVANRLVNQLVGGTTQMITTLLGIDSILHLQYLPQEIWNTLQSIARAANISMTTLGVILVVSGLAAYFALVRIGAVSEATL